MSDSGVGDLTSKRTEVGRAAYHRGYSFQEEVANLYRLLDADVTENIMIEQHKIDILATFRIPGSGATVKVIVECKDRKAAAQNHEVAALHGIVSSLTKKGENCCGEIITRERWGEAAQGTANSMGIALLTYREKLGKLIDFSSYMKDLIKSYEEYDTERLTQPPLAKYFVDLSGYKSTKNGKIQIPSLTQFIESWVSDEDSRPNLAILGGYGTGKTSLCKRLAAYLSRSFFESSSRTRIPILINLRNFTKLIDIEAVVLSFLEENCSGLTPRFKTFQAMNKEGLFLIMLDGFDEMEAKVDRETLEENIRQLERFAASKKCKILLTSRPEYFVTQAEEEETLVPRRDPLAPRLLQYQRFWISPWNDDQIDAFLQKRVPLIPEAKQPWTYYREMIRSLHDLSDLSKRPVMLDMIAKTLPELIASSATISRANLYYRYLKSEIQRQTREKKRSLLLKTDERFALAQNLALEFFATNRSQISFEEARELVSKLAPHMRNHIEACTREFLACSFLTRDEDIYGFSHRSIWEFLVARGLVEEIENGQPRFFGSAPLGFLVADFAAEMTGDTKNLHHWISVSEFGQKEGDEYLGGNSATLLCLLNPNSLQGHNLARKNLNHANFSRANLVGTDFSNATLKDVNLVGARFQREYLEHAFMSNIHARVYIFVQIPKSGPFAERGKVEDRIRRSVRTAYGGMIVQGGFLFESDLSLFTFDVWFPDSMTFLSSGREQLRLPFPVEIAVFNKEIELLQRKLPHSYRGKSIDKIVPILSSD